MDRLYHVILDKAVLPGHDEKNVEQRLAALLKTDRARVSALRAAAPSIIRKNVPHETAERFRKALEKAGAACRIEPVDGQAPASAATGAPEIPAVKQRPVSHAYGGSGMIITNIESVPGQHVVEHFGLVSGSTIRAKHVGRDIMASLKNLVGGELKGYTQLLQESRKQAMERMVEQARQLGANAILNVRFSTSSVAQGAAELYAYGTAVRVEPPVSPAGM